MKNKSLELDFIIKNYKRYKNKYKFTIISIVISIIIFLCCDIICTYALNSITETYGTSFDIYCNSYISALDYSLNTIYPELSNVDGVDNSWWTITGAFGWCDVNNNIITEEAKAVMEKSYPSPINVNYVVIENSLYTSWLDRLNLTESEYFNINSLKAIAIAKQVDYDSESYKSYDLYNTDEISIEIEESVGIKVESLNLHLINQYVPYELKEYNAQDGITVFLPHQMMMEYLTEEPTTVKLLFSCEDHEAVYDAMIELNEIEGWEVSITDYAESLETQLNGIKIIEVFVNLFMLIVILISILNIFNTIYSTITLRRKEFAILTSVGMLNKSINKIIVLENALIFGLSIIISTTVTLLFSVLFMLIIEADNFVYPVMKFFVLILVYSLSVVCACVLSIHSNNKANIIDTLKKDIF
jgi:putative ABC transport system permease protein